MNKVKIEVLNNVTIKDVKYICDIYTNDLSGDVFPNFGKKFLIRFISLVTLDNEGVIIVSKNKGKIIGFLILRFKPISVINLISLINVSCCLIFFLIQFSNLKLFLD